MNRVKLGLVGCGYLGTILIDAFEKGMLSEYEFSGVCARTKEKMSAAAERITKIQEKECACCHDIDELLLQKPDIIVEMASVACVRDIAEKVLKAGCSLVLVSIGALADDELKERISNAARQGNAKVYIASGAVGGFDVLRTISLMGEAKGIEAKASFHSRKNPVALKNTPLFEENLLKEKDSREVFQGSATKAIELLPTKVNVAVATALASVGAEKLNVTMNSELDMHGDDYVITSEIPGMHTEVNIYSATSEIAAWSVVAVLQNITSPIIF